jgi:hypothetical protein
VQVSEGAEDEYPIFGNERRSAWRIAVVEGFARLRGELEVPDFAPR